METPSNLINFTPLFMSVNTQQQKTFVNKYKTLRIFNVKQFPSTFWFSVYDIKLIRVTHF